MRTRPTRSSAISIALRALAGLVLAGALSCGHRVETGTYDFAADSIDKDSCHLAPADGGLWSGDLTIAGEEVTIDYALSGGPDAVKLFGQFKQPQFGASDGFLADGSSAARAAPVEGGPCVADLTQLHLDATVQDPDHLTGLLHITYELTPPPAPDPCSPYAGCELLARFHAAHR